jgi:GxxExxY protein
MFIGKQSELTEKIIGLFYKVYNELGYGFSERVYENALALELKNEGFTTDQQKPICVNYAGVVIGEYFADILVNDSVILELKAVKQLLPDHEVQLLSYLKASPIEVGLLLNFGPKAETKRKVFDNALKGSLSWVQNKNEPVKSV